jgi:general secretion pathway protein I
LKLSPAASPKPAAGKAGAAAGFTLIEALAAVAVAAISLTVIAALMGGNIRGAGKIGRHLQLTETLRAVETALPNRAELGAGTLAGEMHGQNWTVDVLPFPDDSANPAAAAVWMPQEVVITVQAPSGEQLQLETVRLAKRTRSQ